MAYPETIPTIKGEDIKRFDQKLKNFSLSEDQVKRYSSAKRTVN